MKKHWILTTTLSATLACSISLNAAELDENISNAMDQVTDGDITQPDLQLVENAVAAAAAHSQQQADAAAAGTLSVSAALAAVATLNPAINLVSTVNLAGHPASEDNANQLLSNVAAIISITANRENLTPTQASQILSELTTTLYAACGLVGGPSGVNGNLGSVSALYASFNTLMEAAVILAGKENANGIDASLLAAAQDLNTISTATAINKLIEESGGEAAASAEALKSLLAENGALLQKLSSSSARIPPPPPTTSEVDQVLGGIMGYGVAAEIIEKAREVANKMMQVILTSDYPVFSIQNVGEITADKVVEEAIRGDFEDQALQAATLSIMRDQLDGSIRVPVGNETYLAAVSDLRIAPTFLDEGVYTLPDGRMMTVSNQIMAHLVGTPDNLLGFVANVINAGFDISFRSDGAIDIDLGSGQMLSGVFGFSDVTDMTGECESVVITEPAMAVNSPDYGFTVSCENGLEQRFVPYVASSAFYELGAYFGVDIATDRSTGILSLGGIGQFKPGFFSLPADEADQAFFATQASHGFAIRANDVNADGIMDYELISASGVQVLYGL